MSNEGFSLKKVFEESKMVLFSPKEYFSSMETSGGLGAPILKVLVYGVIAGIFALLWSVLNISGIGGGMFGGAIGIGAFFMTIIFAVIGVFVGGLIVLIISSICSGNGEFEPNMRVAAAIMVIMPINAFLGFFDGISPILGSIINLALNLYALYLLYIAVTVSLKGKDQSARIVSYVLGGLLILFMVIGMATRSAVKKGTKFYDKELNKAMEEYQDAAKEAAKALEEEAEELEDEE